MIKRLEHDITQSIFKILADDLLHGGYEFIDDITMTWNDKIMVKVNDKEYLINVKVKEVKKC